jgi:alpha-tubulin suppressor-like RCC1 family protein
MSELLQSSLLGKGGGDRGKRGKGSDDFGEAGSNRNRSQIPKFRGDSKKIIAIRCGSQFSLAITNSSVIFTRGASISFTSTQAIPRKQDFKFKRNSGWILSEVTVIIISGWK